MNDLLLPLELLSAGESAIVEDVHGEPNWVCRMAELGIRPGSCVEVIRSGSPCLLRIAGTRLCLRGEEGTCVMVRPVP